MTKYLILILFSVVFIQHSTTAQTPKQWERHGDKALDEKDFYGAAHYYYKAVIQDSSDLDIFWKYAEALRQYNNYNAAADAYKEVFYLDKKDGYPLALFYWALMVKQTGDYPTAKKKFEQFNKIYHQRDYFAEKAEQEMGSCQWATEHQNDSVSTNLQHINFGVNTFDSEFGARLVDDTTLYYSSLRFDTLKTKALDKKTTAQLLTFQSNGEAAEWNDADTVNQQFLDPTFSFTNVAFDSSGNTMYYTHCNDNGCFIYSSEWNGVNWEEGESVSRTININGYNSTQPFVAYTADKTYLLFATDRERGGEGGYDIWSAEIRDNGKLARARNVKTINTPGNEVTPFYDSTTQSLYFSSDWHNGFGGFDIFKSTGNIAKQEEPENLLHPFNSPANDLYYNHITPPEHGVFVSNRTGAYAIKDETCCNDIYFFQKDSVQTPPPPELPKDTLPEITETDTNTVIPVEKTRIPDFLPITLYFDNDYPNPRSNQATTTANYADLVANYMTKNQEYVDQSENTNLSVFFDFTVKKGWDQIQTLTDSLYKYLQEDYTIHLGVRGYASPLAKSDYNDRLSSRRIASVVNYLHKAQGGKLAPYLNSGQLQFHELEFGEHLASKKVSDDRLDKKLSVYSLQAALERKVEIAFVHFSKKEESAPILIFENEYVDFGEMELGTEQSFDFVFHNVGNDTLQLESVEASCGCTVPEYSEELIAPGEEGKITAVFSARGIPGVQLKTITVKVAGVRNDYKLYIKAIGK